MERNGKMVFWALFFMCFTFSTGDQDTSPKVRFTPTNYLLEITTVADHFEDDESKARTFQGTVTVEFYMTKNENFNEDFQIVLNADSNTNITSLKLQGKEKDDYTDITVTKYNIVNNSLVVSCSKNELAFTMFKLEVKYSNLFGKDMTGFYRSSYKDSTGKTSWLLTTHFEPIYARKVFPCFDQPDLKANFEIHITTPRNFKTVLSNTELQDINYKTESAENHESGYIYKFKKTDIPMSTYLVAFTVSDFEHTEPVVFESNYPQHSSRTLKTYGRGEIIKNGDAKLAQSVGKEALIRLGNYLNLGYALKKVDQVGIPDFSAGAMENWGHISFREKSLFVNETSSSTVTKQSNVLTITHELVHQWFGNLVTLQSWDYIWLNEAFANYLEYVIASQFETSNINTSKWNLMNQLVVNEMHLRAFETDGLNSSKPLNNKITDENVIFSSFNDIPYAKGASVLRMWNYELEDGFQKSLQDYIKAREKNFANPNHLYEAFKKNANMSEDTFKTWTDQPGYPVVEVMKKNGIYKLNQTRFLWDNAIDTKVWRIPITYSTDSSKNFQTSPSLWLYKEQLSINETCKWIIVNNQQAGYYRVNYDKENWEALSNALLNKNYSGIPELNRAQIINDVYSLARSLQKKYVEYSTALTLSKYLKSEESFVVWKTALSAFDFLRNKLYQDPSFEKFKEYVLLLVKPHFKNLNATNLEHVGKLMNIEISRWACSLDYDLCVKQANELFNVSTYSQFPDTQEIVLCTVVKKDKETWDAVFKKYKSEKDSAVKLMYLSALGCTNNETQAEEYLYMTLRNNGDIRKQDLIYVLTSVYNGNVKNVDIAFKFVERNFKNISKEYGGINPLGKALVGIAKKLNTEKQLKKLEELTNKIKDIEEGKAAEESIQNALKIARSNVDWSKEKLDQLSVYLNSSSLVSYSLVLILVCLISVFKS